MEDEILVNFGSAVKALPDGKLGGYAVRFGGSDLDGDSFGPDTNYGFAGETTKRVDILFHPGCERYFIGHCLDGYWIEAPKSHLRFVGEG